MRLRVACKVCKTIYGGGSRDMDRLIACRYRASTVAEATRICRRRWLNRRVPFVPSESEEHERAEILGLMFLDLAKALGVPEDVVDAKKEGFLIEMESQRP
jgi:hypothetical protein